MWRLSWAVSTSRNQASPAQAVSPRLSAMCVLSPSNNCAQRASPKPSLRELESPRPRLFLYLNSHPRPRKTHQARICQK